MDRNQANHLQGTPDLLILKGIGDGEFHGLGTARRVEQSTRDTFKVRPGSLFPALHRLEGCWTADFVLGRVGKRAARPVLSANQEDERRLGIEVEQWTTISLAIASALKVN